MPLSRDEAHYLFSVMRLGPGAELRVFNGRDGEWAAEVAEAGKRGGLLTAVTQTAPQAVLPDLWLLFAPVKKARTDFIVEKAAELGVARIQPVLTDYTNAERVRVDRMAAHVREAAEQSGGTVLPEVAAPVKLSALLDRWEPERRLMFCDEAAAGREFCGDVVPEMSRFPPPCPWAILIGPEGGFSPAERERLRALPFAHTVSLGPRILRAETAAVAAVTLWMAALGDWRTTP